MATWKRVLLRAMGVGVGIGLVLVAGLGTFLWYENRPKPEPQWNHTALTATFDEILVGTEGDDVALSFKYIVENRTDYSITPGDDVTIMAVRTKGRGLIDSSAKIRWPSFIPAKQKVSFTVSDSYPYGREAPRLDKSLKGVPTDQLEEVAAFVGKQLKEIEGFIVFDKRNRYQVELPSGWGDDKKTVPPPLARKH